MRSLRRLPLLLLGATFLAGCNLAPVPPTLDFGNVYVGETAGPLSGHWTNNANKNAQLILANTQLPYAIVNSGVFANAQDIPPKGSSQDVQVSFTPAEARAYPEEVRPVVLGGVPAQYIALQGRGVWAKNQGTFVLENKPPNVIGSLDFSTYPIQPNQPIDWGNRQLGGSATEAQFQVKNSGTVDVNGTGLVRLLHGDRHFRISFPSALNNFNIAAPVNGALGTREIRVEFDPKELGDWMDVIEVTDTANPANRAGIVLKARVVHGE